MKHLTNVRSILLPLIFVGLTFGLQGCGGGGGGSTTPPAITTDQDGSGIYTGTATVDVNTDITDLKGIVYGGRLMFFSATANPHVLYDGTITSVTNDDYTATVNVYENGVKTQSDVAVTGKVVTANSITGTIGTANTAGNHNGSFSLTYDSIYERGATAARIEADGPNAADGIVSGTLSLTAGYIFREVDSRMILNATSGITLCTVVDVYAIPDSTKNVYTFNNVSITDPTVNCPDSYEGTGYSGLISVIDDGVGGTDNRMAIAYSNGTNSVFGLLNK